MKCDVCAWPWNLHEDCTYSDDAWPGFLYFIHRRRPRLSQSASSFAMALGRRRLDVPPSPPPIRSPFCYRRLVSDSSRSPSRNPRRRVECDSKGKSILRESAQGRRRRRRVDADGGGKPYALCTAATMPLWYRWNGGSGRRTGTVLVSFLSFFFLWLSKASECATILTAEKTQSNQFKDQNKPFKPKKTQYNP